MDEAPASVLTLVIRRVGHEEVHFKVHGDTLMGRLLKAYAFNCNVSRASLALSANGRLVGDDDTPALLGLSDGSILDMTISGFHPFLPSHASEAEVLVEVEAHVFRLHKFPILRSESPVLRRLLAPSTDTPLQRLESVPGGAQAFDIAVRFLYKDEVNAAHLITPANAVDTLIVADFLEFAELTRAASAVLTTAASTQSSVAVGALLQSLQLTDTDSRTTLLCARLLAAHADWLRIGRLLLHAVSSARAHTGDTVDDPDFEALATLLRSEVLDRVAEVGPASSPLALVSPSAAAAWQMRVSATSNTIRTTSAEATAASAVATDHAGRVILSSDDLLADQGLIDALVVCLPPRLLAQVAAAARGGSSSTGTAIASDAPGSASGPGVSLSGAEVRQQSRTPLLVLSEGAHSATTTVPIATAGPGGASRSAHQPVLAGVAATCALAIAARLADATAPEVIDTSTDESTLAELARSHFGLGPVAWPHVQARDLRTGTCPEALRAARVLLPMADPRYIPLTLAVRIFHLVIKCSKVARIASHGVDDWVPDAERAERDARAMIAYSIAADPRRLLRLQHAVLASIPSELLAQSLHAAGCPASTRRQVLVLYLLSRTSAAPREPHPTAPRLLESEFATLLSACQPHFGSSPGVSRPSAGTTGMAVEDNMDGDGGASFYDALFSVLVWIFEEQDSSSDARESVDREARLRALAESGDLRLDLLPPDKLRDAMDNASVPLRPLAEAALQQSRALAMQLAKAQAQLVASSAALQQRQNATCEHHHVPILTRIELRRSSGKLQRGTVEAFSPLSGLYAVRFEAERGSATEQRWINLTTTSYRVVGSESSHRRRIVEGDGSGTDADSLHSGADSEDHTSWDATRTAIAERSQRRGLHLEPLSSHGAGFGDDHDDDPVAPHSSPLPPVLLATPVRRAATRAPPPWRADARPTPPVVSLPDAPTVASEEAKRMVTFPSVTGTGSAAAAGGGPPRGAPSQRPNHHPLAARVAPVRSTRSVAAASSADSTSLSAAESLRITTRDALRSVALRAEVAPRGPAHRH